MFKRSVKPTTHCDHSMSACKCGMLRLMVNSVQMHSLCNWTFNKFARTFETEVERERAIAEQMRR